jgi:hypothetical protein
MQKRIYTQTLWKATYLLLAAGITLFFSMFLLVEFIRYPLASSDANADFFLICFLASGVAIGLIATLVIWLKMEKRTTAVDSVGFELTISRPFTQPQTERFEWKNVNSVAIVSETYQGESKNIVLYTLKVFTKGKATVLLTRGKIFRRDLLELMAAVNAATPQRRYTWEPCQMAGDRKVLNTVGLFCQISRNSVTRQQSV